MNRLKQYTLLLSALFFIILGAAMPKLASRMQDAQIKERQKKAELNTVNLTLRKENEVGPLLQMISKKHKENNWTGETILTRADACLAALSAVDTMVSCDLVPYETVDQLAKDNGTATPFLLLAEDGDSALIWLCDWENDSGTLITVDDASGKAVRMKIRNTPTDGNMSKEDIHFQLEKWIIFLQDYYDIELIDVQEDAYRKNGVYSSSFILRFSSKDGADFYDFSLNISNDYIGFNY